MIKRDEYEIAMQKTEENRKNRQKTRVIR